MTHCLFELSWTQAKEQIEQGTPSRDLFYDWFCTDSGLNSRSKNLIPKVNFVFKTLGLDESQYKVFFKNNCPVYGELYDSFAIDSLDDKVRIWVAPKLGFSKENMHHKCEVCVIKYNENKISHELEKMFENWQTFKSELNSGTVKQEMLNALNS